MSRDVQTITERIRQMRELRRNKEYAIKVEYDSTRPQKNDLKEIAVLYERFKQVAAIEYKENIKVFVLIVLFMYSPISFLKGRILRGSVRRELSLVLGISGSSVTIYFNAAKSLLFNHKGFRVEAEWIYRLLS